VSQPSITARFANGFVKKCCAEGLSADETEDRFLQFAAQAWLSRPNVAKGFHAKLASAPVSKATLARFLTPEITGLAVACRIKYGSGVEEKMLRQELGLAEPEFEDIPAEIHKSASSLRDVFDAFDTMPLHQKIFLSALAGGGLGAAGRMLMPNNEDQAMGHGVFSRSARGLLRGAAGGAGAAAGASAGSFVGSGFGPDARMPAALLGGLMGGSAGKHLANEVVG
jgi:hypothetical protein